MANRKKEVYAEMDEHLGYESYERSDNQKKLAAYVILGITLDGRKDVISLQVGENESSKYWLGVLNYIYSLSIL